MPRYVQLFSFAAELSGLLFIGDAILQVRIYYHLWGRQEKPGYNILCGTEYFLSLQINGINVRKCRHEEVVSLLFSNAIISQLQVQV